MNNDKKINNIKQENKKKTKTKQPIKSETQKENNTPQKGETSSSTTTTTSIFTNIKNLSFDTIKLFYTFFAVNIINLSNYFLKELKKRLDFVVPSEDNLQDGVNKNKLLINEINEILKSPEFKEKWDETTENIVELLKRFLDKFDETLGDQLKDVLERFQNIATTSISRTIASVGESALSAVCVIPGANIVCESIDVGSILVQTAGDSIKVFSSLLISFEKMTSAFASIFGDTAIPFSNSIKKVIELKDFITSSLDNATNIPNKIVQGANQYVDKAQQTLAGKKQQLQTTNNSTTQTQPTTSEIENPSNETQKDNIEKSKRTNNKKTTQIGGCEKKYKRKRNKLKKKKNTFHSNELKQNRNHKNKLILKKKNTRKTLKYVSHKKKNNKTNKK